jgi:dTDP-4-amino-4,6-dideoxygalactose transaminase
LFWNNSRYASQKLDLTPKMNVTKTYLPPIENYVAYLQKIWKNGWVTNYGPMVEELEQKLKDYLDVKHLFFVSNGTIALQLAIKALSHKSEIITTPFSYVATTSSIAWEGKKVVFADIDPVTLCIDPEKIRQKITAETSAILATHIYGHPCNVDAIKEIGNEFSIPVIYDAAHAFGVRYKGKSLASYGDVSTLSFHATKLFHTVEGGAVITQNDELADKISYMMNFGHDGPEKFFGLGINGKNSEFHAAMGLCLLPEMGQIISKRQEAVHLYDALLSDLPLRRPSVQEDVEYNYGYYPVIFPTEAQLLKTRDLLHAESIFPRRYFYPSLNTLSYTDQEKMTLAEDVSSKVLCLPLFHGITPVEIEKVATIIIKAFQ